MIKRWKSQRNRGAAHGGAGAGSMECGQRSCCRSAAPKRRRPLGVVVSFVTIRRGYGPVAALPSLQDQLRSGSDLCRRWRKDNFYTVMMFDFDPQKSRANRERHGIDFIAAQKMWDDVDLLEIPARTEDEPRWVVIGRIGAKCWSAVVTYRGDVVRIISVRRSRKEEVEPYES